MVEQSTYLIVSQHGRLHEQHQHHRGSMASALAGRALTGGNTVEIIGSAPTGGIVDITNPIAPDFTGFVTPDGSSGAQEIAKAAPAGDDAQAKARVVGHQPLPRRQHSQLSAPAPPIRRTVTWTS
jgi:hypothetical protein